MTSGRCRKGRAIVHVTAVAPCRPPRYDWGMCSYQEWDRLTRRVQEAVDDGQLRQFLADAAACVEEFVDDLKSQACPPEDSDWVRGRGRRSRTDWVA